MKKVLILFFVMLISGFMMAQSPKHSKGITIKKLFLDFESQKDGGSLTAFKEYQHGFELGLSHRLTNNLNLYVPGKFGVVKDTMQGAYKTVLGADAILQYFFYNEKMNIIPYVMGGVGMMKYYKGDKDLMIPLGAGLNFRVNDRAYINVQSEYRISLNLKKNVLHHGIGVVYLFGGVKKHKIDMGGGFKDEDNDGVRDDIDLCPQVKGVPELNGCPDSDGDGVPDYKDVCPDVKGLKNMKGCPDSDGDGIPDNEDECPNMPGKKLNNGCPESNTVKDRDGDGVADSADKCPDQAGPVNTGGCPDRDNDGVADNMDNCPGVAGSIAAHGCPDRDGDGIPDNVDRCPDKAGIASLGGCPEVNKSPDRDNDGIPDIRDRCPDKPGLDIYQGCPDTDGDGLDDFNDRCPTMAGPIENKGCPKITVEDKKTLDVAMRSVQFDLGKSSLKTVSYKILNQVADIMQRYPDYNLVISGHTDNTGSASKNQKLSNDRARACYNYLLAQGIDASRMNYVGYGESRPIANNKTLRGRSLNRRVEFSLVPAK